MHTFYSTNIVDSICTLNEDESAHCIRTLRLERGCTIQIIDGSGGLYEATILEPHPRCCKALIISAQHGIGSRNYFLHIAIAPPKNIDRWNFFLEKATEIGVDTITPLLCEHSERKEAKHQHSQKILIAAAKQSLSAYMPDLQATTPFADFATQPFSGTKCIAHCGNSHRIPLVEAITSRTNILILIGAEGDFSQSEVHLAQQHGYTGVSMGNRRLRTETAGIAACLTAAVLCQHSITINSSSAI